MPTSVIIAITSLVFILDAFSHLALPWPVLYLIPLLMTGTVPHRRAPLLFAGMATGLVVIGTGVESLISSPSLAPIHTWGEDLFAVSLVWSGLFLIRFLQRKVHFPAMDDSRNYEGQRRLRHLFGERVKELTALHRTVRLLQDSAKPVEEVLKQIVALLPPAWQYPDIAVARIEFGGVMVTTPGFARSAWSQTASWVTADGVKGTIEVVYRETRGPEAEGPFLAEERDLINSLADSLAIYLNRRHAEQALVAAHTRMQALSQQLMTVQEDERRRLAMDLHDEIGQALTAVKMNLQTMLRLGQSSDMSALKDSADIIEQTLQHVRALSLDLRPSLLDDLGLGPAVRWHAARQAERAGWTIDVAVEEPLPELPQSIATACFRVVQEALTNIMRHSQATTVRVALQREHGELVLVIRDNGVGFDVQQALVKAAREGQSMGLIGMQERIRSLNGSIVIRSEPHHGTEVRVRVPITASPSLSQQEVSV